MGKKKKKFQGSNSKLNNKIVTPVEASKEINSKEFVIGTQDNEAVINLEKEYAYVKKDVFKLLITLSVLAVLMAGFYFVGQKTSILSSFGNWIYSIANFQV